ncbi:MAG: glycosyltransferase family 39 protein [Gammaproteobacteria bacterium]|nr:glycosyltransferase family 39 protein [Gammaproteobacteria bacterium]
MPSEFQTTYTARFAVFAQNMLHNGPHLFPFLYGKPYPDYLATTTFITYLSSLMFGSVTVLSITLPNIIVAALTLVFIYLIGSIHSHKWGLYGAIFALFTLDFYTISCNPKPDIYIACITAATFYFAYSAQLYQLTKRLWLLPLLLLFGFMCRGPLGLIVPAGVLFGFYACNKNYKALLILAGGSTILLALCSATVVSAIHLLYGKKLLTHVINMQAATRFSTFKLAYLNHLPLLLQRYSITLPLAIITILLLYKADYFKKRPLDAEPQLAIYLIVWAGIVFVGLALVTLKIPRYFSAMVPALALICASLFVVDTADNKIDKVKKIIIHIFAWLPYLALVSIIALTLYSHWHNSYLAFNPLFVIIALALTILLSIIAKRYYKDRITIYLIVALLSYVIIFTAFRNPPTKPAFAATNFMQQVQKYNLPIAFYKIGRDNFDLQLSANSNSKHYFQPQFIKSQKQLDALTKPTIIITDNSTFKQLITKDQLIAQNAKIVTHAKVHKYEMVAFRV